MKGGPADRLLPAASAVTSPSRAAARIRGIDAARAIAILGMVMVHFTMSGPGGADGQPAALPDGPRGRAAILFVLLAGIGVTLLDRSRSASRSRTRQKLLWRSVVLLPVGLALQELDHGAAVILQDYALLFWVALVAVALSDRWLLGAAAVAFFVGPGIHVAAEALRPDLVDGSPTALTDPLGRIVMGLVLTGPYPLVTWTAPLLFGMWLGRRDLTDPRVQGRALAAGATVALGALWGGVVLEGLTPAEAPGWWSLAIDPEPHSQSFVWLWQATAAAVAALAASLVATEALPRLLSPLVALGQLALTVYVGHLLLMAAAPGAVRVAGVGGAGLRVVAFTAAAAAFSVAWRSVFRRGPLEAVLDLPFAVQARHARRDDRSPLPAPATADE